MGENPYDALVTGDGRTYIAGLFGADHLTALDLWQDPPQPKPILPGYAEGRAGLPVYKMPHLARPDGRQVWVNFAHPLNDTIQVIDTLSKQVIHEFKPGPGVLHMEFTPRGHEVWLSVRDAGRVIVYDTETFEKLREIEADSPSGIFFTARAHKTGL